MLPRSIATSSLILFYLLPTNARPFSFSLTLGDHAVLSRDGGAIVWGYCTPGATVSGTLDGSPLGSAPVGADGVWRVCLTPQPPGGPHSLVFRSTAANYSISLNDVLFGHVFGCGGQSNAWFPTQFAFNGSTESLLADDPKYSSIRVMTTGAQPAGSPTPPDFLALEQPWARASNATIFSFSAICWFFARRLVDSWLAAGAAPEPLGLISDNIGGTGIALWSSNSTLTACGAPSFEPANPNPNPNDGALYSSLIRPLTTGVRYSVGDPLAHLDAAASALTLLASFAPPPLPPQLADSIYGMDLVSSRGRRAAIRVQSVVVLLHDFTPYS